MISTIKYKSEWFGDLHTSPTLGHTDVILLRSRTRESSDERTSYVRDVIIEPGVYRDKPTGAILLILGMRRVNGGDDDPNYVDLIDLVVLSSGDVPYEWPDEGVFVQATEEVFDNSRRGADGRIIPDTHLERVV